MIICVAGKNNIAVDVLSYLLEHNNDRYKLCVCCNRNEKGEDGWQKSLRAYAIRCGILEYSLEEIYEFKDLIFLSMEYDRIIAPEKFSSKQLFNIHFSKLPAYKGMYTSTIPILHGEKTVGVTLHEIDSGIDTGNIIAQKVFRLQNYWNARDLYFSYLKYGTELVIENIEKIIAGNYESSPQPAKGATYYSKKTIDYSNIHIDFFTTAEMVSRQIRAYSFKEYQLPMVNNHVVYGVKIKDVRSVQKPGTVVKFGQGYMTVSTIDYDVTLYI